MEQVDIAINRFKQTLTKEEVEAGTYFEWSDATIARLVRILAGQLSDDKGDKAILGISAVLALEYVAIQSNARE